MVLRNCIINPLNIEKAKRNGESIFQNFDMEKFSAGTFGMFGGKETPVRMEFENRFVGVVLDRKMLFIPGNQHDKIGRASCRERVSSTV